MYYTGFFSRSIDESKTEEYDIEKYVRCLKGKREMPGKENRPKLNERDAHLEHMKRSLLNGGTYLAQMRRDDASKLFLESRTFPEFVVLKPGLLRIIFPVTGGQIYPIYFQNSDPLYYTSVIEDDNRVVKYEAPYTTVSVLSVITFLEKMVKLCEEQHVQSLVNKYSRVLARINNPQ